MGLFPSPEDRGHSQKKKKKKNTGKRAKRLVPCAEREKKNDKEPVKGQEINFFLLTDL